MFRLIGWQRSPHFTAVFQALFVTFLWSTSWVLIKIGLEDIPALTFAGLRYGLASLCLLPFFFRSKGVARSAATVARWLVELDQFRIDFLCRYPGGGNLWGWPFCQR